MQKFITLTVMLMLFTSNAAHAEPWMKVEKPCGNHCAPPPSNQPRDIRIKEGSMMVPVASGQTVTTSRYGTTTSQTTIYRRQNFRFD